jgi:hypothetical protein
MCAGWRELEQRRGGCRGASGREHAAMGQGGARGQRAAGWEQLPARAAGRMLCEPGGWCWAPLEISWISDVFPFLSVCSIHTNAYFILVCRTLSLILRESTNLSNGDVIVSTNDHIVLTN